MISFHIIVYSILKIGMILHVLPSLITNDSYKPYLTIVQSFTIDSKIKHHPHIMKKHNKQINHSSKLWSTTDDEEKIQNKHQKLFQSWGVTSSRNLSPALPNSINKLSHELYTVITKTLCNKQYYDPKVVSNIRCNNILFDYCPYIKKNVALNNEDVQE